MRNGIPRLAEALDIIAAQPEGLTVTDLAKELGVSVAASSRLVSSLMESGLVERDSNQRHFVDLRVWPWASSALRRFRLRDIARPSMIEWIKTYGTRIHLVIARGADAIFLESVTMLNGTPVVLPGVDRIPTYACAAGKVILAFGTPDQIAMALSAPQKIFTSATVIGSEALEEQIAAVKSRGYATSQGDFRSDVGGLAVPILDASGHSVAAIGISYMLESSDQVLVDRILPSLKTLGANVSAQLGYVSEFQLPPK